MVSNPKGREASTQVSWGKETFPTAASQVKAFTTNPSANCEAILGLSAVAPATSLFQVEIFGCRSPKPLKPKAQNLTPQTLKP